MVRLGRKKAMMAWGDTVGHVGTHLCLGLLFRGQMDMCKTMAFSASRPVSSTIVLKFTMEWMLLQVADHEGALSGHRWMKMAALREFRNNHEE